LKPGGRYLCRTPSKVSGPHDVSMFFGDVARGMHMQEYSYETLVQIFKEAGFVRPRIIIAPRAHRLIDLSYVFARPIEMAFAAVPRSLHTLICRSAIGRTLLGITIIAEKPKT
jgi:hypothetical protein